MPNLLTTERLKNFSDSVLLVAITILAYNLVPPTIVNGQVNPDEMKDFFYNLYGLISSFAVISSGHFPCHHDSFSDISCKSTS